MRKESGFEGIGTLFGVLLLEIVTFGLYGLFLGSSGEGEAQTERMKQKYGKKAPKEAVVYNGESYFLDRSMSKDAQEVGADYYQSPNGHRIAVEFDESRNGDRNMVVNVAYESSREYRGTDGAFHRVETEEQAKEWEEAWR